MYIVHRPPPDARTIAGNLQRTDGNDFIHRLQRLNRTDLFTGNQDAVDPPFRIHGILRTVDARLLHKRLALTHRIIFLVNRAWIDRLLTHRLLRHHDIDRRRKVRNAQYFALIEHLVHIGNLVPVQIHDLCRRKTVVLGADTGNCIVALHRIVFPILIVPILQIIQNLFLRRLDIRRTCIVIARRNRLRNRNARRPRTIGRQFPGTLSRTQSRKITLRNEHRKKILHRLLVKIRIGYRNLRIHTGIIRKINDRRRQRKQLIVMKIGEDVIIHILIDKVALLLFHVHILAKCHRRIRKYLGIVIGIHLLQIGIQPVLRTQHTDQLTSVVDLLNRMRLTVNPENTLAHRRRLTVTAAVYGNGTVH